MARMRSEEPKRKQDHIFYARNKGCANSAAAASPGPPTRAGGFFGPSNQLSKSPESSERSFTEKRGGTCSPNAEKSLGALSRNEDTV